eukprot:scaffold12574_cov14-Tisochrysis_lutea.AAC.2
MREERWAQREASQVEALAAVAAAMGPLEGWRQRKPLPRHGGWPAGGSGVTAAGTDEPESCAGEEAPLFCCTPVVGLYALTFLPCTV